MRKIFGKLIFVFSGILVATMYAVIISGIVAFVLKLFGVELYGQSFFIFSAVVFIACFIKVFSIGVKIIKEENDEMEGDKINDEMIIKQKESYEIHCALSEITIE